MAEPVEREKIVALGGWPMLIGWAAMLIFAIHACTHMVAAGDTWVAMACGRHFVNHGVNTVEPFSANSHKAGPTEADIKTWPNWAQWIAEKAGIERVKYWHPTGWINQNWLTHVLFYVLTPKSTYDDGLSFSSNVLVYWKFAIYILATICVYFTGRILGVNPALSAVFACFAIFIGRSFFDIRPAGFSNLMVAVFLLVLVLTTHRNKLYIWLVVPLAVLWCNLHGGYIYVFIMLVPFVAINFLTSFSKKSFVSIGRKGVYHTAAAGIIAFIATILFNPFHLTNLTHTFEISVSKHAEMWRSVNEWHPAFEWGNPVGTAVPFLIMFILALAAIVVWTIILILTYRFLKRQITKRRANNVDEYKFPKIDLAMIVIAAMTIYMAIESRRFIPIAAIAACPVIAMLIDQVIRAFSAVSNSVRNNRLVVPAMPKELQWTFIFAGILAVLVFGTWWGLKFKTVYLDPWPTDTKLNSMFMRMSASDAKPFAACKFIKDNKLEGKMFNYWTEGGFVAWGQEPDPNTGKTPLQLFIDGRAQAAYQPASYNLWLQIMSAGPIVQNLRARGKALTSADYVKVGQWLSEQLRKQNVWIALMPASEFETAFVDGLEHNPEWSIVFLSDRDKMFIDNTTPQGQKLLDDVFNEKAIYPNEYYKDIMTAHNMLLFGKGDNTKAIGLDSAMRAFESIPSQIALQKIIYASQFSELRPKVTEFCKIYFDDFSEHKKEYVKKDGYHLKIVAALITGEYLQRMATQQTDRELYANSLEQYRRERERMLETKRW